MADDVPWDRERMGERGLVSAGQPQTIKLKDDGEGFLRPHPDTPIKSFLWVHPNGTWAHSLDGFDLRIEESGFGSKVSFIVSQNANYSSSWQTSPTLNLEFTFYNRTGIIANPVVYEIDIVCHDDRRLPHSFETEAQFAKMKTMKLVPSNHYANLC